MVTESRSLNAWDEEKVRLQEDMRKCCWVKWLCYFNSGVGPKVYTVSKLSQFNILFAIYSDWIVTQQNGKNKKIVSLPTKYVIFTGDSNYTGSPWK